MTQRVAVVTGSNKGLGYAVVKGLCKTFNGIVYLTCRNEQRGIEAVRKLSEIGLKPSFHKLDVSDKESVENFANFIKTKHGGFDVLVNNAAILEWEQVYPDYEAAKRNIDINYRSLLTIEEFLFPLLRDNARVVNISSACGHLSNLKNEKWLDVLQSEDLTTEQINEFVDEYLQSVRDGTFNKEDFVDNGKHAEHRVSKIALTALTMVQQKKYYSRNISINAVHPGHVKTDMARGGGVTDPDEAAKTILYLINDASPKLKGTFIWSDGKIIDWFDVNGDYYYKHSE
ncbi:carbonyl reductase [NADPH] 1-like [Leptidea sinapis]|uniref:carbonyl reductase [NADPH] 1-like n=1 Tax=Leptidea sinapis TaxID=189913 RepID=UPI0021322039|nr:carbonyl reductase [NADPH] 1-like [Leptidea sinapis]